MHLPDLPEVGTALDDIEVEIIPRTHGGHFWAGNVPQRMEVEVVDAAQDGIDDGNGHEDP